MCIFLQAVVVTIDEMNVLAKLVDAELSMALLSPVFLVDAVGKI